MQPPPDITDLPYRRCVGIMLFNREGRVWVGRRVKDDGEASFEFLWQMPQGGIDPGEEPRETALRELFEETGLRSAEILAEHPDWLTYDFPPDVLARKGFRNRGQTQKWFALLHTGADSDFDLNAHDPVEFDDWRWEAIGAVPGLVVAFKRPVYEAVAAAFTPIAQRLAAGTAG